jgi:hypothetical protein
VRRVTIIYADGAHSHPPTTIVVTPPRPPFFPVPPFFPDPRPNDGGYDHGHGGGGHSDSGVAERGLSFIKEDRSIDIQLPSERYVRSVEVKWSDGREKAVGYVSLDGEGWNARRGIDVGSPDTVTFDVGKRGRVVRLHAKRDDIRVLWVRVYYDNDRGNNGGGNGGGGNPHSGKRPKRGLQRRRPQRESPQLWKRRPGAIRAPSGKMFLQRMNADGHR